MIKVYKVLFIIFLSGVSMFAQSLAIYSGFGRSSFDKNTI